MSVPLAVKHQRLLIWLGAITMALWALLGLGALLGPSNNGEHARFGEPVFTDFANLRPEVSEIRFVLADEQYSLVRIASGWALKEAGNYPIRTDRLAALASGLEGLLYDEKRTNDPGKHRRIGLSDPAEGGNGVRIEILGPDGAIQTVQLIGRKETSIYVREPGSDQTYRAKGDLPPFYHRRAWLDLDIIDIDPSAIRSVRLSDAADQSLYLNRPVGADARSFRPAPPNENDVLVNRFGASTTALAITRLSPLDVQPASALLTEPVGRHISETFDGLEIDLSAYRETDGTWVTVRAVEAGEGARRAEVINTRAKGWAFRVSEYDFQDFTPAVSDLVSRDF